MSLAEERRQAVRQTVDGIDAVIAGAPDIDRLDRGKALLMDLCKRSDLFPREEFPLPEGDATDRTFLIHENDAGMALYAITSIPGMTYRPHDHGGSWAIVAAIAGQERHMLYERANPADDTDGRLIDKGEIICEPGCAVSLLPRGIHAIEGIGDEPLLHLHLYGIRFQDQADRTEFDLETGKTDVFRIEAFGFIEDKR